MGWRYSLDDLARIVGARPTGSNAEFHSVSTDTRTLERGAVFFALSGERFDGAQFVDQAFEAGAVAAVTTGPSEAGVCLVVDDPLQALQKFAGRHRSTLTCPLIAITGSCGKTTSKDLIAAGLSSSFNVTKTQGNLNNEIGVPLSLFSLDSETDIAVVEMGANHVGEIARLCEIAKPTESAITMIAPAHLEGFGSIDDVARAKAEIASGLEGPGPFYVNTDDPRCVKIGEAFDGDIVRFGSSGDVVLEACEFDEANEMVLRISPIGELRLPLQVRAHAANVLLAVAIGLQHGIENFEAPLREACAETSRFTVMRVGPLEILDDSYNANPASVRAAIETLAERPVAGARIAALGDMLELGPEADRLHAEIGRLAGELGVDRVYARGDHAATLIDAARSAGVAHAEVIHAHDEIGRAIAEHADEGDALLVKGSRGMAMEKVIDSLRGIYEDRQGSERQDAVARGN